MRLQLSFLPTVVMVASAASTMGCRERTVDRAEKPISAAFDAGLKPSSASSTTGGMIVPAAGSPTAPHAGDSRTQAAAEFTVYRGLVRNDDVALAVECRGTDARALYARRGESPILLGGKADCASGVRTYVLDEAAMRGKQGLHLDAAVDETGRCSGKLIDPQAKTPTEISLGSVAPDNGEDGTERTYEGSLGTRTRIRAKWTRRGTVLRGQYRYARSKENLEIVGTVAPSGTFEAVEKSGKGAISGRWSGVFVGPGAVLGRWTAPDGSKTYPLWLSEGGEYPEIVNLPGGGKIAPLELSQEHGKACRMTALLPTFDGLPAPAPAQVELNATLRKSVNQLSSEDCDGAVEDIPYDFETSYTVTAIRAPFVGLDISRYEYSGGAHGNFWSSCWVVDTRTAALSQLASQLTAEGQAKLTSVVNETLRKRFKAQDLTEAGFYEDTTKIASDTCLCVRQEKGILQLQVAFAQSSVAPYVLGPITVNISATRAKGLFAPGSMGAALFR